MAVEADDYQMQRQERALQLDYARAQRAKYRNLQELGKKLSRPSFSLWMLVLLIVIAFEIEQVIETVTVIAAVLTGAGIPVAAAEEGADDLINLLPDALIFLLNWYFGRKYKSYQEFQEAMQEGYAMSAQENAAFDAYEQTRAVMAQMEEQEKTTQQSEKGPEGEVTAPETGQTTPHTEYKNTKLKAFGAGKKAYHAVSAVINFVENPWGFFKMLIFWGADKIPILKSLPFRTYATFMAGYRCHKAFHQVLEQWEEYQKSELARM